MVLENTIQSAYEDNSKILPIAIGTLCYTKISAVHPFHFFLCDTFSLPAFVAKNQPQSRKASRIHKVISNCSSTVNWDLYVIHSRSILNFLNL